MFEAMADGEDDLFNRQAEGRKGMKDIIWESKKMEREASKAA